MDYRDKKIVVLKTALMLVLMLFFVAPSIAEAAAVGDTTTFSAGSIQTFTAPVTGYYRLETWGAQGGTYGGYRGGYGAYATGVVFLNKNDKLYVVVGTQPGYARNSSIGGGYNGGGSARTQATADYAGGGGGATHIATKTGLLSTLSSDRSKVLIVAAGGGGGYYYPSFNSTGGEGGGISGGIAPNGTCSGRSLIKGSAATQSGAGSSNGCGGDYRSSYGGFGYGHSGTSWQSGGGSGWFGGGSGMAHGGNGGSSYIGNSKLLSRNGVTKAMYCYSCAASSTASTYTVSTTNVSTTATRNYAKGGSGAAKITILEIHNTDARIQNVDISGTNFSDVFHPDTYTYNYAVDPDNSDITIQATPVNSLTTIVGNTSYTLPVGVTKVMLTSTSESGNVLVYRINITRAASSYQYLKDIKIGGTSLSDFNPTKLSYNIDVPYGTETLNIDAIKGRPNQSVYFPPDLTVRTGNNQFEIIVVSEDGQNQTTYTLNVTKPHTSKLKSLSMSTASTNFALQPSFNSDTLEYTVKVMPSTLALTVNAIPYDEEAKVKLEGFGYIKSSTTAKITVTEPNSAPTVYTIKIVKEGSPSKSVYDYPYSGRIDTFKAPVTGYYQLETWGAQGGSYGGYRGGYGAYATGAVFLNKDDVLYIVVGGQPGIASNNSIGGGYNGGGSARTQAWNDKAGGGGGATHISTKSGLLSSLNTSRDQILIVSAGGGGGYYYPSFNSIGGEAGGIRGGIAPYGTCNGRSLIYGAAATQTSAGSGNGCGVDHRGLYSGFGYGRNGTEWQAGGGAGWFGGGSGFAHGGNGGSSYIGNSNLTSYKEVTKSMYCYNCTTSNAEDTYTVSTTKVSSAASSYAAKSGSGYARITLLPQPSENNFLSSITVKATHYVTTNLVTKTYTPNFSLDVQDYYVTLDPLETTITLAARLEDSTAKIDGLGKFDVPAGTTDFKITVTAESKDQRVYTVHVTRPASSDQYPLDITINGLVPSLCALGSEDFCKLNPADFDKDTHTYYLTVPYRIKQLYFSVHKGHPNQTVTGEGKVVLKGGENTFDIDITSEDGTNTTKYQYVITRDMTGNTDIELEILDPEKKINFDPDISEYYITVDNNYKKFTYVDGNKPENKDKTPSELKDDALASQMDTIQLYIKTDDEKATFTVDGPTEFVTGMNQIKVTVTGASGEIFIYVLNVYRSKNENVFLSTLEVSDNQNTPYTIQPAFNKANTGPYQVTVPNDISQVTIKATTEAPTSKVTGTGVKAVNVGENRYDLHVTAENGTVETYTVIVTREKNSNPNLANITVSNEGKNYTLTPNFDPSTIEYEVTVEEGVSQVAIDATPELSTTTYKLLDNPNIKPGQNIKRVMGIAEDGTTKIYTITITRPASSNNDLSDLTVKNGETIFPLTPIFQKEIVGYTLEVENEITYVDVLGTKENPLSTMSGQGRYALIVGTNKIEVSVVAENGDYKVYTIIVTRKPNANAHLKEIQTSAGTLDPAFDRDTVDYTMHVDSTVNKIKVTGVPEVTTTQVTGNNEYTLVSGINTIELVTLAEDGVSTLTYTIQIEKDPSDNNNLSYLVLEESTLSPTFTKEQTEYRAVVPYEIETGVFHIQTEDPNATYRILNNGPFVVGENEVTIEVMSESGLVKNYVITVVRQEDFSNSDYLALLAVDQGTLNPVFSKEQLYYEVTVPNSITKIHVTATPEDRHATVTGDGDYHLNVGVNFIAVKVTSTENKTREYQIVVTRQASSEARLSELAVQGSTLNPIFNRDITAYQLETTETKLTFSKIKTLDDGATYDIIGNKMTDLGVYTVIIRVTAADQVTQKDYELTVTRKESNNNNLANLRVVDYEINPAFKKTTTLYYLTVGNDVNSIVIEATPEQETSTVTGDGYQLLAVGENQFVIEVTSESGNKKVYTLVVTKEGSNNNKIQDLIVNNGTMTPSYDPDTYEYDVVVEYEEDALDLTVILEDDKATYQVLNNQLKVGNNQVQVIVTAENGSTQIYKLNVVRKEIVSALLENIIAKNYLLSPDFNSQVTNYNIVVNYETEKLDLTVIPLDKKATYQVSGNQDFIVGNNMVVIEVTASDGKTKETYILNVTRQPYANTFLDYLYTSEGDLTPTYQKETLEYSIDVAYGVTEIELIGEASDKSATVTGLGVHPLQTGENILEVKVTALNGATRTYRITVNRDRSEDNYLLNLEAKVGATLYPLNPEFDKSTLEYSITVPEGTPAINLTGTLSSSTATVTGLGMHTLKAGENKINIIVTSESGKIRTYTVTVNRAASNNNHLIELIPSVGELEPDFSYEETNYTIHVDSSASLLSFSAITEDPSATVTGLESQVIPDGTSTRTITVTAEDGSKRVYTITVQKERTDNARLSHLSVTGYPFDIPFDPDVYGYKIVVPNTKQILLSSEVNATAEDPNATIEKNGNVTLSTTGPNEYVVTVIAPDGFTKQSYVISIEREKGTNTLLNSLVVNKGSLETPFNPSVFEYNWLVPRQVLGPEDVTAIAQDPNATIEKTQHVIPSLTEKNQYIVKVIAEDGSDFTEYILNLVVDVSSDATLANLEIDKGYYLPTFDPNTKTYDVYEYVDTTEINITATPTMETATVTSGDGLLNITSDEMTHAIVVTAEDGTKETYTLNIHRTILTDQGLKNLGLNGLEDLECSTTECVLSPPFTTEGLNYRIQVPHEYTNLDILAETMNDQQTVKYRIGENYITTYQLPVGETTVIVEVYDGMNKKTREYTLVIDRAKSGNNNLSSLEVVGYELDPLFNKSILEYTVELPTEVEEVEIKAIPEDTDAQVSINGYNYLEDGENEATVVVTAPNGNQKTYIIHLIRSPKYNSYLRNITVSTGIFWELEPKFKPTQFDYTTTITGAATKATIEAVPVDPTTKVEGTGEFELVTGVNKFQIITTAGDGSQSTYTITVIKETSRNVNLSNLIVEEGELSPKFEKGTTSYEVTVDSTVDQLTIHAILEDKTSSYIITGNEHLVTGDNKVNVIVTNSDKTVSKTYQLTVHKLPSSNADLADLIVKDDTTIYPLTPEFNKDTHTYTTEVPHSVEKVVIEATPKNLNSLVMGAGEEYLSYGLNERVITVTAEDGTINMYTVQVYRNYNLDLTDIISDVGTLTPAFNKDQLDYRISLPDQEDKITFVALKESNLVKVTGNGDYELEAGDNVIKFVVTAPDGKTKTYTVTVNRGESDNNFIESLLVHEGVLSPVFNKNTNQYEVRVINGLTQVGLDITLEDPKATYQVLGNQNLHEGSNLVTIRVTAENGDTRDYTIDVIVQPASQFSNRLLNISITDGTLTPTFDPDKHYYTANVSNTVDETTIEVVKENVDAKVTGIGRVSLEVGRNVFQVLVTSKDGFTNTYTLIINRAATSDATLSNLVVTDQTFTPIFNKLVENYQMTVGGEVLDLDVVATPTDPNATVKITGNKNLQTGENTVTILVTAPDGITQKTYTITVNRGISTNNYLSSLKVNGFTYTPEFNKTNSGPYTLEVGSTVNSVVIEAIPEIATTIVTGDGKHNLTPGQNLISVQATSESGNVRVYTILINKLENSDSTLRDIILSDGELDPEFDPATLSYTVTVDKTITDILISGVPTEMTSTVSGNGMYSLTDGGKDVELVVTSASGSKTTYHVKVKVEGEEEFSSLLADLVIKEGRLQPEFSKNQKDYMIRVPYEVTSLQDMEIIPEDPLATYVVEGNQDFIIGVNPVKITVTNQDHTNSTVYTIQVIRQKNASNYLTNLSVDGYAMNPVFNKTTLYYEVEVPNEVDSINIRAIVEDPTATVIGDGTQFVSYGKNRFYVDVTSASGVLRTYSIVVTRNMDTGNLLLTLDPSVGTLDKEFDPHTNEYTLTVPAGTTMVNLAGTVSQNATVTGLGDVTISGTRVDHTINVTSQDGVVNVYKLTITYPLTADTELISLTPSSGTLDYSNDITEYEMEVDESTSTLSFVAVPKDPNATVTGCELTTLNYGENEITIVVTAADGKATRTIKVKVTRKKDLIAIIPDETDIILTKDEVKQITYTLDPTDTSYTDVEWISADENIVTVDQDGNITGVKDGSTTVKIQSKHDPNIYATINVNVISTKITSSVYDCFHDTEVEYVIGAEPSTVLKDFIPNFDNNPNTLHVYKETGEEVTDPEEIIGSYMVIKLIINDTVYDELVIAVRGDLDGDGLVTAADRVSVKNCILGKKESTFIVVKTADIDLDDVITAADGVAVKNYMLGRGQLNDRVKEEESE